MLKLAFTPKNWTLYWKLGSPICFIIISIVYYCWGSKLHKITNLLYYWLCCKFANKFIMFQKALQFHSTIVLYYSKQIVMRVNGWMPLSLIWHICEIVVDCFSPIVYACVLHQSHGHWLLNDVLHFLISMRLKLKVKNKIILSFESLVEDDSIIYDEFSLLAFNIKREVINVLDSFFSFWKNMKIKKLIIWFL